MEGKKISTPERGYNAMMEGDNHENKVLWAGVFGVKLAAGIYGPDGLDRQGGNKPIKENSWIFEQQIVYLAHPRITPTKSGKTNVYIALITVCSNKRMYKMGQH